MLRNFMIFFVIFLVKYGVSEKEAPEGINDPEKINEENTDPETGFPFSVLDALDNADPDDQISDILNYSVPIFLHSRFGGTDDDYYFGNICDNATKTLKSKSCEPESHIIRLINKTIAHKFYVPNWYKIKECAGVCNNGYKSCLPTKTRQIFINIGEYHFKDNTTKCSNVIPIMLIEHEACQCSCHSTDKMHEIIDNKCTLGCKNQEDKRKCRTQKFKLWDEGTCRCTCKDEPKKCSTGSDFNRNTCKCERKRH